MALSFRPSVQLPQQHINVSRGQSVPSLGFWAGLAVVAVALCNVPASAQPILYGDFMGNTVSYLMVTEEANSANDMAPLFGPPTVLQNPYPALPCTVATCTLPGDTLDFNPVGFSANSMGGTPDITDGQLTFMVIAKPGQAIKNIQIKEFGDTTLAGVVPVNSMLTSTAVRMPTFIDIVEVDGVGINPIKLNATSVPAIVAMFTPSDGDFFLGIDGNGGPTFTTQWTGELFVDLQAVLVNRGISFERGITKISVSLDNTLIATSEANTQAVIAKKDFFIITTNIPEPTSFGLAMLAAVGACAVHRARRP
jgi:hypothetical protein